MNRFFSRTVFTCVDCDGYRTTGKKLVILGDSLDAMRLAFAMRQMFTPDITLILPAGLMPDDHAELLAEDGIAFLVGNPQEFLGDTVLTGVKLTDGQEIACEVVMLSYDYTLNDSCLAGLGLAAGGAMGPKLQPIMPAKPLLKTCLPWAPSRRARPRPLLPPAREPWWASRSTAVCWICEQATGDTGAFPARRP